MSLFTFVGIIAYFAIVLAVISRLTGWVQVAKKFPEQQDILIKKFRFQSMGFSWGSYNNCVSVGIGNRGLHLSVPFPISLFHNPIFIPWTEIKDIKEKKMWWIRYVCFDISNADFKVRISNKAGLAIIAAEAGSAAK